MSMRGWKVRVAAAVVAGVTAFGASGSGSAAPVLSSTASLKQALPGDVQNVRWWGRGGAFFGGVVAGGLIGAAIARPYYYGYGYGGYGGYGYGYPYAYGYGYPAYGYSYAPAYYGYAYAPRPAYCWRYRYGYRYRVC